MKGEMVVKVEEKKALPAPPPDWIEDDEEDEGTLEVVDANVDDNDDVNVGDDDDDDDDKDNRADGRVTLEMTRETLELLFRTVSSFSFLFLL